MLLHAIDVRAGPRNAHLFNGMMVSAESWDRVTALLVERGYRVIAPDLPGHGRSPRDPLSTAHRAADAVVETLAALDATSPTVAIGHSYGATVLACAATRLAARTTVYVDAGMTLVGGHDIAELTAQYETDRRRRTVAWLRANRSYAGEAANLAEARAAEQFDAATAAAVSAGDDVNWSPRQGDIVVRADPSAWVSERDVDALRAFGVQVRSIPDAAHTVWYSHFDAFVAALPEVFTG